MLSDRLIKESATRFGVDASLVKAVIMVETPAPHVGDSLAGPLILFERHKFYKYSGTYPVSREYPHLSNRRAGGYCRGRNWEVRQICEHRKLKDARTIYGGDIEEAALMSVSMGAFQIMGFNYQLVEQPSVGAMWERYLVQDDRLDLEDFFLFCKNAGLLGHLQNRRITPFVRGYNGRNHAKNDYVPRIVYYDRRFRTQGINAPVRPIHPTTIHGFPNFDKGHKVKHV